MINRKQLNQQIKLAIRWGQIGYTKDCQSGFTIIESLMAIIVVAILLSATAPAIIISVGNRVQARRVESATQAARAYIDGVRSGAIQIPKQFKQLSEVNATTKVFTSQRDGSAGFSAVAAPTSSLSCTSPTDGYCANTTTSSLYCVDGDRNGGCTSSSPKDLIIQAFRSTTSTLNADTDLEKEKGYVLGVRVYRADGFQGTALKTKQADNAKSSSVSGGLGDRQAPLIEMTTEVASKTIKYEDYCERFGGCQQ